MTWTGLHCMHNAAYVPPVYLIKYILGWLTTPFPASLPQPGHCIAQEAVTTLKWDNNHVQDPGFHQNMVWVSWKCNISWQETGFYCYPGNRHDSNICFSRKCDSTRESKLSLSCRHQEFLVVQHSTAQKTLKRVVVIQSDPPPIMHVHSISAIQDGSTVFTMLQSGSAVKVIK